MSSTNGIINVQVADGFLVEETVNATTLHPFGFSTKTLSAKRADCLSWGTLLGPSTVFLGGCNKRRGVFSADGDFRYNWASGPSRTGPISTALSGNTFAYGGAWCTRWDEFESSVGDCQPTKSQLDVFRTIDGQQLLSIKWNEGFFVANRQIALSPSGDRVAFWHGGVLSVWKVPPRAN
jgi:hypothetical protein